MSGGLSVMALEENDVTRFLAASTHLGSSNMNFQMEQYVFKRRQDGKHFFFLLMCFYIRISSYNLK